MAKEKSMLKRKQEEELKKLLLLEMNTTSTVQCINPDVAYHLFTKIKEFKKVCFLLKRYT